MKALFLNSLKREKEAYASIKMTLMKNMANFTVWHVYGMLNRTNKDYDMARKAYTNALKFGKNKDTERVLTDLSQLQIYVRDYEGFANSRREILLVKPNMA
jgi:uncharacterized protein HemY